MNEEKITEEMTAEEQINETEAVISQDSENTAEGQEAQVVPETEADAPEAEVEPAAEAGAPQPAAEPAAEEESVRGETELKEQTEQRSEPVESMDDYTEEIDASLRRIYPGDVMECTVVAVDETAVSVDLDYYAPGKIIPEEMSADPLFSVFTDVKIGDQFRAVVQQADDGAGNIVLSKKEADKEFSWEKLEQMKEEKTMIEGTVSGITNSGAILYVEGIRGFIPASKLDLKYVEDTNPYLGKPIRVIIAEVDRSKGKLILSAKELLVEASAEKKLEDMKRLSVGSVMEGTVEKIMDYGAFVDIGNGLSGLLHVSEISEKRIAHPKAVLKNGQKVQVTIIRIENGKISLSMKAAKEAEEEELNEEATEYKSEYVPNNPFADLFKDLKF